MKRIGKSVGRRNPGSIARQVMAHRRVRNAVLKVTTSIVQKEMKEMCKRSNPSILRNKSPAAMETFNWDLIISELKARAPTLLQLLKGFVEVKQRRVSAKGKARQLPDNATISICSAILLRHKNQHMNLLQRIISMILYSGHTNKQASSFIEAVITGLIFMTML